MEDINTRSESKTMEISFSTTMRYLLNCLEEKKLGVTKVQIKQGRSSSMGAKM